MSIETQIESERELFEPAREQFDDMVVHLMRYQSATEAETEEFIRVAGLELHRRLLQARLDVLLYREKADLMANPPPKGAKTRQRERKLETQFGRVIERRHGHSASSQRCSQFPLDDALNMPAEIYSHPLRRRVAEKVVHGSFDHAVEQIESTTGGHVPKRQAQQLTQRASQDVESFYEQRCQPANDHLSDKALLVMSSDGAAIRMVPEGLREATRMAAHKAAEESVVVRGDPTAAAPLRPHQKRRAMVSAVWEQERHRRKATDIIANLNRQPDAKRRKKARGPRPQNKRVTASVEQDHRQRIAEMFDEADRRDPERRRETVTLVDGDEEQTRAILEEAQQRGRSLTLVLDLLHVMHYLWVAAMAVKDQDKEEVSALVTHWTTQLLTSEPCRLVATIRGMATRLGLRGKPREAVDRATNYLLKRTPFINYASFIARGLPIATGVIEGACRYLVRDRMDITGAQWGLDDAEAVLKLRAVYASGDWEDYWAFHLEQERVRNYASAA